MERAAGFEVCGEARGLHEALTFTTERPDVVAIEGTLFLQSAENDVRNGGTTFLVFVESSANETTLERILSAGPSGVVSKSDTSETWLQAFDVVARGARFLSPNALEGVLDPYLGRRQPRNEMGAPQSLTRRECEVVSLLAEGGRNRELASTLGISVKTVEHHRASAMRKLGVRGVSSLVREAIRLGLVAP